MTWTMTFGFRDDEGHTSEVNVNFADSIVLSNAASAAISILALIAPLTEAAFTGCTIGRILMTGTSAPTTGADIEIGVNFLWSVAGSLKKTAQKIPAFVRSKLVPTTSKPDLTDTDIADFVAFMEDGITATTLFAPTSDIGTDLAAYYDANEIYGKKRGKKR